MNTATRCTKGWISWMPWHILWSSSRDVQNIIQGSSKHIPDTIFDHACTVALTLEIFEVESKSWSTIGSQTIIVWSMIQIEVTSESLASDTNFCYVYSVTLVFRIWPWMEVMTLWSIIQIIINLWKAWPWNKFLLCVNYDFDHGNTMAWTRTCTTCSMWPWRWRYDHG